MPSPVWSFCIGGPPPSFVRSTYTPVIKFNLPEVPIPEACKLSTAGILRVEGKVDRSLLLAAGYKEAKAKEFVPGDEDFAALGHRLRSAETLDHGTAIDELKKFKATGRLGSLKIQEPAEREEYLQTLVAAGRKRAEAADGTLDLWPDSTGRAGDKAV